MKEKNSSEDGPYRMGATCQTRKPEDQLYIVTESAADRNRTEIVRYLNALGIYGNYKGFFYLFYAVELSLREPERVAMITKWIYPDVAKRFQTTPACIERNIRHMIHRTWERDGKNLLIGCDCGRTPTNSQFLAAIVAHFGQVPQNYRE